MLVKKILLRRREWMQGGEMSSAQRDLEARDHSEVSIEGVAGNNYVVRVGMERNRDGYRQVVGRDVKRMFGGKFGSSARAFQDSESGSCSNSQGLSVLTVAAFLAKFPKGKLGGKRWHNRGSKGADFGK